MIEISKIKKPDSQVKLIKSAEKSGISELGVLGSCYGLTFQHGKGAGKAIVEERWFFKNRRYHGRE